jgi:hypothetical protein
MVALQENQIVITISTPTPGETLTEMQAGIIEALQGVFVAVAPGDTLEVESTTANGFYYLLQLLRESLFDGATVEAAQGMAEAISSRATAQNKSE